MDGLFTNTSEEQKVVIEEKWVKKRSDDDDDDDDDVTSLLLNDRLDDTNCRKIWNCIRLQYDFKELFYDHDHEEHEYVMNLDLDINNFSKITNTILWKTVFTLKDI